MHILKTYVVADPGISNALLLNGKFASKAYINGDERMSK